MYSLLGIGQVPETANDVDEENSLEAGRESQRRHDSPVIVDDVKSIHDEPAQKKPQADNQKNGPENKVERIFCTNGDLRHFTLPPLRGLLPLL